jgi:hypothetical protein
MFWKKKAPFRFRRGDLGQDSYSAEAMDQECRGCSAGFANTYYGVDQLGLHFLTAAADSG